MRKEGKFIMAETEIEKGSKSWKVFLRKHLNMLAVFLVGAILASIGAILVYLWVVGEAQLTGLVPTTLGQWTMGYLVTFILHLLFWEVLLVGIPVIIAAIAGWLWWRRLPSEEKKEYHFFGTRSRATSGGGGSISPLIFIAFCIKVFTDGNWNVAFEDWTFDYLVYSCLTALVWVLIVFGIPMVVGALWWIRREMKKEP
jgi:hypothetical protein